MNIEIDTTKPGMDMALLIIKDRLKDCIYNSTMEIAECKKYLDETNKKIKNLEENLRAMNSNKEVYESRIDAARERKEAAESILEQIKEQESR